MFLRKICQGVQLLKFMQTQETPLRPWFTTVNSEMGLVSVVLGAKSFCTQKATWVAFCPTHTFITLCSVSMLKEGSHYYNTFATFLVNRINAKKCLWSFCDSSWQQHNKSWTLAWTVWLCAKSLCLLAGCYRLAGHYELLGILREQLKDRVCSQWYTITVLLAYNPRAL